MDKKKLLISFSVILTLLLNACAETSQPILATPSLAPVTEATATPTIVWFPPTATPTIFATYVPTQVKQSPPGMGSLILTDDFSDLSNWSYAAATGNGSNSIIVERNRLTFAINVPPASLFSLKQEIFLTDFYAEANASINRCLPGASYGILFRSAGDGYAYRYLINCSGQTRLDYINGGTVYPIKDWEVSGDAPAGAPGQVKMGVWAAGSELRFYLNDNFQFSIVDGLFSNGTLGFIANSGPEGMNVSFSDLAIYDVSYVSPTPTPTASNTPPPTRTPRP